MSEADQTQTTGTTETEQTTGTEQTTPPTTGTKSTESTEGKQTTEKTSALNEKTETESKGAPEKYEEFKVPEGFILDSKVSEDAGKLFKEMNLDQTSAQKLVDFYIAKTTEAAQAPYEAYDKMRGEWRKGLESDPEIGKKLDEVKQVIGKAYDAIGDKVLTDEFRQMMDVTGAGDHPAFAKVFYKLAQAFLEGKPVQGKGPVDVKNPGGPELGAKALYPTLPSAG